MLERKEKEITKRNSLLFKAIFISFLYALFKFSANSPCMPKIHSIPLPFTGPLAVDNGDHLPPRVNISLIISDSSSVQVIFFAHDLDLSYIGGFLRSL